MLITHAMPADRARFNDLGSRRVLTNPANAVVRGAGGRPIRKHHHMVMTVQLTIGIAKCAVLLACTVTARTARLDLIGGVHYTWLAPACCLVLWTDVQPATVRLSQVASAVRGSIDRTRGAVFCADVVAARGAGYHLITTEHLCLLTTAGTYAVPAKRSGSHVSACDRRTRVTAADL